MIIPGVLCGVSTVGLPCAQTFKGLHSVRLWTPTIFRKKLFFGKMAILAKMALLAIMALFAKK
jgi:hypothetical protein